MLWVSRDQGKLSKKFADESGKTLTGGDNAEKTNQQSRTQEKARSAELGSRSGGEKTNQETPPRRVRPLANRVQGRSAKYGSRNADRRRKDESGSQEKAEVRNQKPEVETGVFRRQILALVWLFRYYLTSWVFLKSWMKSNHCRRSSAGKFLNAPARCSGPRFPRASNEAWKRSPAAK